MDQSKPASVAVAAGAAAESTSEVKTAEAANAAALEAADALIAPPKRAKRGFAVLSPEKKREIASMGGKAAHEHGRAHRFTSEEARAAGKRRHQLRMIAAAQAAAALPKGAVRAEAAAAVCVCVCVCVRERERERERESVCVCEGRCVRPFRE